MGKSFRDLVIEEMQRQNIPLRKLATLADMDSGNTWRFLHDPKRTNCNIKTAVRIMRVLQMPWDRLEELDA